MRREQILSAMCILCLVTILIGCTKAEGNVQDNDSQSTESTQQKTIQSHHLDDLEDALDYLGKTTGEVGVPDDCIYYMGEHPFLAYGDGKLWNKDAYLDMSLENDYTIDGVKFLTKQYTFEGVLDKLSAQYGEMLEQGEEPYVESQGGTVRWAKFETPDMKIHVRNASNEEYVTIDFQQK